MSIYNMIIMIYSIYIIHIIYTSHIAYWYTIYYRRKFGRSNLRQYGEMKKQSAGRRVRGEKIRRKKMQVREKVGKLRFTVFFRGFVAPEGRKVGSLKRRVRRHFLELRCRKSARRCGAKHILKSKCTKHTMLGPLLEVDFRKSARRCGAAKHISKSKCTKHTRVRTTFGSWELSKQCTPLWREAHFEVKMYKAHPARTTFRSWDVEKLHAVVARSIFRSQNVQSTPGFGPLLEVEFAKKCTPLWREAHFQVNMHKAHHARTTFGCWEAFTTLHYTTLHYTILHYTTLPCLS